MLTKVPEPGQLVEVRNRPFVVAKISKSIHPASLLTQCGNQVHHLATLCVVEADALGEELQVIWEVEPEAHIDATDRALHQQRPACRAVLARLLALNHERYAAEVKARLHEKKGKKKAGGSGKESADKQMSMFEP